ncbi:MAG: DNA integrity scanning protein DisA nucleotide-binding domain protein [Candidatus Onthovivens sp.]|nr:DNA integrity scanning protein DisA nucleotide-binding domain protein [Candidatus Onthovivens sp.]
MNFLFDCLFTFPIQDWNAIADFIISSILVILIDVFLYIFVKRKFTIISTSLLSLLMIVAKIFKMDTTSWVCLMIVCIFALYSLIVNMAETRFLFANKASKKKNNKQQKNQEVEKIFDHEDLYKTINETVLYLSKNKIGGLITFERKDKLKDIIKNGSVLNSPVTFELLITIFYPGTRLHDGAVVIKGDKIIAASVYYTPTTKPLTGKYGSRHRAAIGISEICDAVTVVVSEETGRISIAYNGLIENYAPDNFYKAFENIMKETEFSE